MLTVALANRSVSRSARRIIKAMGLKIDRPRHRYFGMSIKRWVYNVLLADRTVYDLENYGRNKQWVIAHKFGRNLVDLPHMGLELEYLLHYSMWEIKPVRRHYVPTTPLSRQDCVMIKRLEMAFGRIYSGLFTHCDGKRHKYNKINKLVREMLKKQGYDVKCRQLRALFAQYNHTLIRQRKYLYYNNLNFFK